VALGNSNPRFRGGIVFPEEGETLAVGFNLDAPRAGLDLPEGAGFRVEIAGESPAPGFSTWLCLVRHAGGSRDLFSQMAADVVAALSTAQTSSESWLLSLMLARIRAWQDFMRKPKADHLSPEEELGLIGELSFLLKALDSGASRERMVHSWVGPYGGLQDFQSETLGIEVKSTTSVTGFPARISSLEQLDGLAKRAILLAALRFSQQLSGHTLPELVGKLRNRIVPGHALALVFERGLLLAGYDDTAADNYTRRLLLTDLHVFEVDAGFPCLRRSTVSPAIRAAIYDIDLDLANGAMVPLDEALGRFGVLAT